MSNSAHSDIRKFLDIDDAEVEEDADFEDIEPGINTSLAPAAPQKAQPLTPPPMHTEVVPYDEKSELGDDINTAKKNIHGIIEQGKQAIDMMMSLAAQTDSHNAYTALFGGMKVVADLNKELVKLSEKKDLMGKTGSSRPDSTQNITNNNLVISTKDLLAMLKEKPEGGKTDES